MSIYKRYATFLGLVLPLSVAAPSALVAQDPPPAQQPQVQQAAQAAPAVSDERLAVYVRAFLAERRVQDEYDPLLAAVRNKHDEMQVELREARKAAMEKVYADHGMTEEEFKFITFVVSSDQESRVAFEALLEAAKNGEQPPQP